MYENWEILKTDLEEKQEEYSQVAEWCNNGGEYHIEDDGTYYKTVKNLEPSIDELKTQVRAVRDSYLQETDFTQLPDAPFTTEEKAQYSEYRQYLRDYTRGENWWEENPKTFEEWSK
jgi:hypothetical protein